MATGKCLKSLIPKLKKVTKSMESEATEVENKSFFTKGGRKISFFNSLIKLVQFTQSWWRQHKMSGRYLSLTISK